MQQCKNHPLTDEEMHVVFVEVVEEVRLLWLVDGRQHVLGVQQHPDDVGQLDSVAHFRIGVAIHLLDDYAHQEGILELKNVEFQIDLVQGISND